MSKISLSSLSERINLPINIVRGMIMSGLFGITDNEGNIFISAIESYEKYGTQWDNNLEARTLDYSNLPPVSRWENAPIGTFTKMEISANKEGFDLNDSDSHWIAQLYIKPNNFFFVDPDNMTLIGSCSIQLKEKTHLLSDEYPDSIITLYPHPDGSLALISVFGKITDKNTSPLDIAMKMALPILSELVFRSDRSIHISQKHWIGLPSGTINIETKKRPKNYEFNLKNYKDYHGLREAKSLYFTALNCNEPMSQFLSFYRVIELTRKEANIYLQTNRQAHRIPNHPVYGSFQGKKVTAGADELKKKFRNSIAHANSKDTVISENSPAEYHEMLLALPLARFIAKEYITIVENYLKQTDPNYSNES